ASRPLARTLPRSLARSLPSPLPGRLHHVGFAALAVPTPADRRRCGLFPLLRLGFPTAATALAALLALVLVPAVLAALADLLGAGIDDLGLGLDLAHLVGHLDLELGIPAPH